MEKICVKAIAQYTLLGDIIPLYFYWNNDNFNGWVKIDKILEKPVQGASLKIGIQGIRYKCRAENKVITLWFTESKWYVENNGLY
jgi:hypothetical protein